MKTSTGSNYSQPSTSYPPSVPLYVYRELTGELQAVQSKLDVVTSHNQKLAQENQQLRQEITKVIQSCLELQKLVDASVPSSPVSPRTNNEVKYQTQPQSISRNHNDAKYTAPPSQQTSFPRPGVVKKATLLQNRYQEVVVPVMDMNFPVSETIFIEEEEVPYSANSQSETKGLNGWWLVITIILIMVTGFAAGYLIVRPLLQNQSQPVREIKN